MNCISNYLPQQTVERLKICFPHISYMSLLYSVFIYMLCLFLGGGGGGIVPICCNSSERVNFQNCELCISSRTVRILAISDLHTAVPVRIGEGGGRHFQKGGFNPLETFQYQGTFQNTNTYMFHAICRVHLWVYPLLTTLHQLVSEHLKSISYITTYSSKEPQI